MKKQKPNKFVNRKKGKDFQWLDWYTNLKRN